MKTRSLSHQLAGGVLLAELLCAAVFSGVAIMHEMHGRRRAFDVMLRGRADSLLGAVQDAEDPDDNVAVDPTELTIPQQDSYEVLSPGGRTLGQSPASPTDLLAALNSRRTGGYFNFRTREGWYRAVRFDGIRVIDRNEDKGGLRRPVTVIYASPTRDLWHEAVEAVRFYVAASVLLLSVTASGLVWFLRRRLSPLQDLAAIAGRVSPHSWEFVPPNGALRTAELAPIAISIQQLVQGLQQAFERQRRLTGDAAHELKTSIAVLKSGVQLLAMSPRTAEQYEAGLEGLLLDTERMEELANRMLSLARLEEAPVGRADSTDLQAAVATVAERLRPLAELRQVELDISGGPTRTVAMQAEDAEVLCSNLIMNALQHSSPAGHVSAVVLSYNEVTELRVVDQGNGIPEASLPHVFDRFYRADYSRSRNSGGAGLGLSICKAIIERANGTIKIQSKIGSGTEVTVSLPTPPN
ncbi:MAG: HAMP domain-containing sensor histidine kinase [Acidobacteriaceae bacterium]|jgi:signal transduction histidine kinase